MGFEIAAHARFGVEGDARVSNRLEGVGESNPLVIHLAQDFLEREDAGIDAGSGHGGAKPRALFVGPRHDLDGCLGLDAVFVQCPDDLEGGEDAVGTVEPASGGLGVEVAPGQDR